MQENAILKDEQMDNTNDFWQKNMFCALEI
jgi:hypothetical protein